jgi:hypothetical protein
VSHNRLRQSLGRGAQCLQPLVPLAQVLESLDLRGNPISAIPRSSASKFSSSSSSLSFATTNRTAATAETIANETTATMTKRSNERYRKEVAAMFPGLLTLDGVAVKRNGSYNRTGRSRSLGPPTSSASSSSMSISKSFALSQQPQTQQMQTQQTQQQKQQMALRRSASDPLSSSTSSSVSSSNQATTRNGLSEEEDPEEAALKRELSELSELRSMTKQQRQQRQQQQQQQQQQQTLPQWQQPHVGAGAVRAPSPVYDLQEGVYYRSGGALSGMAGAGAAAGSSAVAYAQQQQQQQQQVNEVGEVVVPLPATAEEVEADRQRERARRKREKAAAAEEEARERAARASAARYTIHTAYVCFPFFVSPSSFSFLHVVHSFCILRCASFGAGGALFLFSCLSCPLHALKSISHGPFPSLAVWLLSLSVFLSPGLSHTHFHIDWLIMQTQVRRGAQARGAVPGDGAARAVSRQRYRRARPPRVAFAAPCPQRPLSLRELRHAQRGRAQPVRPALRRHDGHRGGPRRRQAQQ